MVVHLGKEGEKKMADQAVTQLAPHRSAEETNRKVQRKQPGRYRVPPHREDGSPERPRRARPPARSHTSRPTGPEAPGSPGCASTQEAPARGRTAAAGWHPIKPRTGDSGGSEPTRGQGGTFKPPGVPARRPRGDGRPQGAPSAGRTAGRATPPPRKEPRAACRGGAPRKRHSSLESGWWL